ncbi:receptor-like protein EIX2 [Mangifera indica]|uniref:receptor-like protein EIX2 n=1 Tax=Mangifera indica TaxID=29780 RepID=UPI001CFA2028|nr:receptor-like protein EIX2 [Mangifera indica]
MSMKPVTSNLVAFLFLELLAIVTIHLSFCSGNSYHLGCIESEREALLRFKHDLEDPSNRLASWSTVNADCCTWSGVVCDNMTGHVLELNLGKDFSFENITSEILLAEHEALNKSMLRGKINPSLLNLKQLISLDLSCNDFKGAPIPKFFGNMRNLRYLNLSEGGFQGRIPHQLGNLSNLEYLDIGWANSLITDDYFGVPYYEAVHVENLQWLSGLPLLKHLDLTNVDLSKASDWLQVISTISSLEVLNLINCQLYHFPSQPITNLSSLAILHLSGNNFEGPIPDALQNLTSLRHLFLSYNFFNSSLPDWWYKLTRLEKLYLPDNRLQGYNSISGPVPTALGKLGCLQSLDFSYNKFTGTVSDSHFANLTRLLRFGASGNSLTLKFNLHWVPPFRLQNLTLSSCNLGSQFPSWIRSLKHLSYVDISNSSIFDSFPTYLFEHPFNIVYLDLSHNSIYGLIPNLIELDKLEFLDLSSNNLSGPLPLIALSLYMFDLSNNSFSGSIFHFLCHEINASKSLLQILILKKNLFHGNLPDCWENFPYLTVLNLNENNFSGNIPISFGSLSSLQYLHLRKNNFFGTVPVSLKNCTEILTLDLGENSFVGNVPTWLGVSFPQMVILNLRSNKFQRRLPRELCHLALLQILDIADNNFHGTVPRCISNFSAITNLWEESSNLRYGETLEFFQGYIEDALLVNKGQMVQYNTILLWVRIMDLSKNNFSGEIPMEVTNLVALQALNLSHNHFTGTIPKYIGVMRSLECIDLSGNQLSGEIPQSISNLTFLSYLNFSNNKLIGKIPLSTQIQGFDASCFTGNDLCGPSLSKNCGAIVAPSHYNEGNVDNEHEVDWFYVSMTLGFMLIGNIPLSTQIQGFDPSCFIGNDLCGSPLSKNCGAIVTPSHYNEGNDDNEHEVD